MRSFLANRLALAAIGVAVSLFCVPETAQAQLTRGAISGTVTDQTGAPVPGATVTVTALATNQQRSSVTSTAGFYRLPALEPGRYAVKVEMSGFSPVEHKDVPVRTNQEVTLDVGLQMSTLTETIDITAKAEAVLLNKTNGTVGLVASGRQAVELPLSAARNVNNLALLSPNVSSSVGQTNISANGQRSRNNNFTIDGTDNNDIAVTIATTPVVPEAVAEFQVQTNAYNAEFGRNSGAQLNIITRSGTNAFHGDLFEYYRGSTLNAMDNREKAAGRHDPARTNRNQAGFALGGPLVRDRTFFFLLGQADRLRSAGTLGAVINVPTPAGLTALQGVPLRAGQPQASRQAMLSALQFLQGIYAQSPVFQNRRTTLVNGVPIEIGAIQVGRSQPNNTWNFLGRIDHRLGPSDSLTARWIYNQSLTTNNQSNTNFGPLFAGSTDTKDSNLALSETHIFSSSVVNEARFSWIRRNLQFPENDPTTPTTNITGFFTIGGAANFPQGRIQNSFQLEDVVTMHRGRHTIKAGADVRYITLDNISAFDSKGTFTFASLQDFMNNLVNFQQALQTASFYAKQWQVFPFIQDDFRITPELTLNVGLRYEMSTVPLGLFGATDPESLRAMVPGPVQMDKNNFSPRVGFAWSPRSSNKLVGDGQSVVRGGYGRGYDVVFYNIHVVNGSNYPRIVVLTRQQILDVFPTLIQGTATARFDPLATYVNSPEDLQLPESDVYSLSMQREIGRDVVVEVGYTGSRNRHQISQDQANPAVLTDAQAALVASTRSTLAIPNVQARRVNRSVGPRVLINDVGRSSYDAGFISVQKRFAHGFQLGAAYTLSRLMSNSDESLALGFTASSPQIPQDYSNLDAEWSRSVFDRPHRFVVNYLVEIPLFKKSSSRFLKDVIGGWQTFAIIDFSYMILEVVIGS